MLRAPLLAVVWQTMEDSGANLAYTIYDAGADLWGADQTLMDDDDDEAAHSPTFGDDGTLYVAYQKVETQFVTRTFELSPTHTFEVTNIPQPGDSQLAFLAHTVGRDLADAYDTLERLEWSAHILLSQAALI